MYRWGESEPLAGGALEVTGALEADASVLASLAAAAGLALDGEGGAAVRLALHGPSEWEALVEACNLDTGGFPGAFFLAADVQDGTFEVDLFAGDDAGRFHGIGALQQLMASGSSAASGRDVALFDRPAIAMRGLIEGFYGTPWTPQARLDMIAWAGTLRMTHYLFAPKAEPLINTGWMLPFGEADLKHYRDMAEAGRRHRVRICFELHPSWMFHYSSDEDMAVLVGKLEAVVEQGIDCLVLAFDDVSDKLIPPDDEVYPDYTSAQVDFVPRLGEALLAAHPDLELVYVPVEYYTDHPRAKEALPAFAEALPDYWKIAWTGRGIGNGIITLADAQEAAALMGRKPLLGDNYPVSDDANKTGVLFLGPLTGRAPDLLEGVSGIAFNAMPMAYASLPALATAADYAWNPAAYEPAGSMADAARLLAGAGGSEALYTLAMANRCPMLEGSAAPELVEAIAGLWAAFDAGEPLDGPAEALRDGFLTPYRSVEVGLASDEVLPGMAGELAPWASKLTAYGEAGELALTVLIDQAAGKVPDPVSVQNLADRAAALKALLPKPTGAVMDEFLDRTLLELEGK
jgi:hypothetical protein